jgi:hypothetical protein
MDKPHTDRPDAPRTDWLEILRGEKKTAQRMKRDAKKILADQTLEPEQAKILFEALERQADFVEKLRKVLDAAGYEPDVVKAAEMLEEAYAELAATVAKRLKAMMAGPAAADARPRAARRLPPR